MDAVMGAFARREDQERRAPAFHQLGAALERTVVDGTRSRIAGGLAARAPRLSRCAGPSRGSLRGASLAGARLAALV